MSGKLSAKHHSYSHLTSVPRDGNLSARWNNVSESVFESLKTNKKVYIYADDVYKAISEECVRYGVFNDVVAMGDLVRTRASQYNS